MTTATKKALRDYGKAHADGVASLGCLLPYLAQYDYAPSADIELNGDNCGDEGPWMFRANWNVVPKGQAAFQQVSNTVSLEIHVPNDTPCLMISVSVYYEHHSGGTNGICRNFMYCPKEELRDEIFLPNESYHKARDMMERIKNGRQRE